MKTAGDQSSFFKQISCKVKVSKCSTTGLVTWCVGFGPASCMNLKVSFQIRFMRSCIGAQIAAKFFDTSMNTLMAAKKCAPGEDSMACLTFVAMLMDGTSME